MHSYFVDLVITKDQIESYIELKQEEPDCYLMTPHPVEFDMYYSCGDLALMTIKASAVKPGLF